MNFRKFLKAARDHNASDIHIVAGLPPALRVSGEIIIANGSPLNAEKIKNVIYEMLTEEQKKCLERDLQLCFSKADEEFGRYRTSIYYHDCSPEMAIRMCSEAIKTREELQLPETIDNFIKKSSGLILITGPTGVGKTTTMNYMIDQINCSRRCKIVTIEDPIEYIHHHKNAIIIQQEMHSDVKSFSSALIHVLRQDPDVICIGEMRDLETISTALTAAETGHLVIATLHTPDVSQSVERIIGVFPANQQGQVLVQLSSTLVGVISQQLMPTVDRQSRVLATEVLACNMAIRHIIRNNECYKIYNIIETSSSNGMHTMDYSLSKLYDEGLISYDSLLTKAAYPDEIRKKYNPSKV